MPWPLRLLAAVLVGCGGMACALAGQPIRQAWVTTVTPSHVPEPHLVESRAKPTRRDQTRLIEFASAPFPYEGLVPGSDQPFLNFDDNGRRGHRSAGGNIHWLDETYSDSRVLLHIPKGFDVRRPGLMVLFFHGHGATLERDVLHRQRVPQQVSASGINAVLVAPQLAFNAADSSAGKLWQPGGCRRMLAEAASRLATLMGSPRAERTFATMPVLIVGYSGGYLSTASCLTEGGLGNRVRGVVLLDGLYGEMKTFENWLTRNRSTFFISSYTGSTEANNLRLRQVLEQNALATASDLTPKLSKGSIAFLATAEAPHRDFVTRAWTDEPLADVLRRAKAFSK